METLQNGTGKIQNGSQSLSKGLEELSTNSTLIKNALDEPDNGAKSALDGGNKLTSGTFPVETIDKSFQAFTSWLPMTYSIRIFKDCLIPTDASLLGGNTLVILAILIILFIINTVIEFMKEKNKNTSTETIQYNKNDK